MPFVAAVPFWFLAGKYALENSSIVCRVPLAIYFLVDILYLWKLGRVVIEFPCVVAYWFRKNFDQIGSHIGIVSWNIQHILCLFSSFKQRDVGEILVDFQGRWTSIYYFFDSQIFYKVLEILEIVISINFNHVECGDGRKHRIFVDNFWIPRSKTCTFPTPGFLTEPCYYFFSH